MKVTITDGDAANDAPKKETTQDAPVTSDTPGSLPVKSDATPPSDDDSTPTTSTKKQTTVEDESAVNLEDSEDPEDIITIEHELAPTDDEAWLEEIATTSKEVQETEISDQSARIDKTIEEAMQEAALEEAFTGHDEEDASAIASVMAAEAAELKHQEESKPFVQVTPVEKPKGFRAKCRYMVRKWWHATIIRNTTIAFFLLSLILLALLPFTRYAVLNLAGVRVQASITIVDAQTRLPLKNINVRLQDTSQITDDNGAVTFYGLKLGNSDLSVQRRGYAQLQETIVLGWGSNPLNEKGLQATGEQFTFVLKDWQTDEPVTDATATAGEFVAKADGTGKIILTIGEDDISDVEVTLAAEGYRDETYLLEDLNDEETIVAMVQDRKHTFVSNRNSKFDIYTIDIDGQNESMLLEATGKERDVPTILHHPSRNIAALISSRNGEENKDGFVLESLFILNTESGEATRVARSERLQLLGWSGDEVVFVQVVEGTSAGNPQRSKLSVYNERTLERRDIAASNYFNDVQLVGNTVYYAVSSYAVPISQAKLFSDSVAGNNRKTVIDQQVWSIFRNEHDTLQVNAEDQKWYQIAQTAVTEIPAQNFVESRHFVDTVDGTKTAWVDIRDGKGTLLSSPVDEFEETNLFATPGLSSVIYWVGNDVLVYQVISNSETADYLFNTVTGESTKLRDVTTSSRSLF